MTVEIVFETHALSEDNERGVASGWNHSRLSAQGRQLALALGRRRCNDGIALVFTSDLRRAVETTELAFDEADIPILHDWRLRECDYGGWNGQPAELLHGERWRYLDQPYPAGESWRKAVKRVRGVFADLQSRWEGQRVLVVGHVATRWALDHYLSGVALETLARDDFGWREGWEYRL
jgi:broad specificity phosphatase PhoE